MNYYVYICKSSKGTFYTGISHNPQKRLHQHNNTNQGSLLSKLERPLKLVWISHKHYNLADSRHIETQIKGWTRVKKQKLISGEWQYF